MTLTDDGRTGTNFARPGFLRLMDQVRAGEVDCVVVKDLSRLGRDYVETGNFMEQVFPFYGVRLIAVNDGYDSAGADGGNELGAALKNLVNELYSRDISAKTAAALREKQRRGEFIGNHAPYGYLKHPADRNRLILDPETAPVVRALYGWRAAGEGGRAIAERLNREGVPSPGNDRYQRGLCRDGRYAAKRPWTAGTVWNILKNPVYLGTMAQGKKRSVLYEGVGQRRVAAPLWKSVEHTHEAIVSSELFQKARERGRKRGAL